LLAALLIATLAAAPEGEAAPLFQPLPGSSPYLQKVLEPGEFLVPIGKNPRNRAVGGRSRQAVGKVTLLGYQRLKDQEPAAIAAAYRAALEARGYQILFACALAECGQSSWFEHLGPIDQGHYLGAKLARPKGDVYLALLVHRGGQTRAALIETGAGNGKAAVTSEALLEQLKASGRAVLLGVAFEEGKAELKDGSGPSLDEAAKLLMQVPELALLVVGHTDAVGDVQANVELSKRRAGAVTEALVAKGISPARLTPQGAGPISPLASNDAEAGRARNRRIELVKR
jgi:outer membrane protein OmpA-like peptidoglycan-associated protein